MWMSERAAHLAKSFGRRWKTKGINKELLTQATALIVFPVPCIASLNVTSDLQWTGSQNRRIALPQHQGLN
jgi:hypothetical protein